MYNHIASGETLARVVAAHGNLEITEALKSAVRGVDDPREQLQRLAEGVRRWALENRGLYLLMARVEPEHGPKDPPPAVRDLLDLFERPLAQLGVPEGERIHGIRSLRAAIHGFALLESSGQFQLGVDIDASFHWMVESLIRGVASAGAAEREKR